jgi:hypothetical protein
MRQRDRPTSQGWKTFLHNHAAGIVSIDLFVVRTITFELLYGIVDRRSFAKETCPGQRDHQSDGRVDRRSGKLTPFPGTKRRDL